MIKQQLKILDIKTCRIVFEFDNVFGCFGLGGIFIENVVGCYDNGMIRTAFFFFSEMFNSV